MDPHAEKAKALFESGYNCAQSLLLAFAADAGLDEAFAARLSSSFGGGMGRLREVCGAVSSSFMVVGLLYGNYPPGDDEAKAKHYQRVQQLAAAFQAQRGSLLCRDLLGLPAGADHYVPEKRTPEYYASRPCAQIIADAAQLLAEYISSHPPEGR